MSAERITYLDSSAIVKLVVKEPESAALGRYLRRRRPYASSALARAEVARAVMLEGEDVQRRGLQVLRRIDLIRVSDRVLAEAGALLPPEIRTLDAVHLATATLLGESLSVVVTYDSRMSAAAEALGVNVAAPS